MKALILKSPAKLNLYLRVIRKRPDGYHELKTIFQRIGLYDELCFLPDETGKIRIECDHPYVPCGSKNLVYKVALALKQKFAVSKGVTIKIVKRIPVAAGLAGGSSNAATALLGLNRVWSLGMTLEELLQVGNSLGSDIAFFLNNCSWALGEGRGEKITRLPISKKFWHILVVPKVKMYTPEVYGALKFPLTNKMDNANILIHSLQKKDINKIKSLFSNDLEQSILTIAPKLEAVRGRLKALGVKGVSFSGSGPSVFGVVNTKQEAEDLCGILKKRYSQVFAVSTC